MWINNEKHPKIDAEYFQDFVKIQCINYHLCLEILFRFVSKRLHYWKFLRKTRPIKTARDCIRVIVHVSWLCNTITTHGIINTIEKRISRIIKRQKKKGQHLAFNVGFCLRMASEFFMTFRLIGFRNSSTLLKAFSWRFLLLIASVSAYVARYPAVKNSLFYLKDAMNYFTLAYNLIPRITELLNIV